VENRKPSKGITKLRGELFPLQTEWSGGEAFRRMFTGKKGKEQKAVRDN